MNSEFDECYDNSFETFNMEDHEEEVKKIKRWDFDNDSDDEIDTFSIDIDQLKQFGDPAITTQEAASQYLDFTKRKLCMLGRHMSECRALVFFAIHWKLHTLIGIRQKELISNLRQDSGKCRDTLHRYVCAAKVESQLQIQHGGMAVQALMELYRCHPETRGEILEIAIKYQKMAEAEYAAIPKKGKAKRFKRHPKPFPFLIHIKWAIKHFNKLEKMRKEAIASGENPNDVELEYVLPHKSKKHPNRDQIISELRPKRKIDPEELEEDAMLVNVQGHFVRMRSKEKILNEIDYLVKHGSIKIKKCLLDGITASKRDNKIKFYVTRLLAYNDSKKIQEIMRSLKWDIEEFEKHHAELS